MSTSSVSEIYITGNAAEFAAACDEASASASEAAAAIDDAFGTAGTSAAGSAADITASFDAAATESSAAVEAATAKMDASFDSIDASAAASGEEMTAAFVEAADAAGTSMVADLGAAGDEAGAALTEGITASSAEMVAALSDAGVLAGEGLAAGVEAGTADIDADLAATGAEGGAEFGGGLVDGLKEFLGPIIAAVAGAISIDFAEKMQTADTAIANSANISEAAAHRIGTAFLGTAGTVTASGEQMATAYSKVAGELGNVEGHALTTKQALTVMTQATQLSEATNTSLSSATSVLAQMMQSYGLKVKTAASASNTLYNASRIVGTSITTVGKALAKIKTKLGDLAPSLATTTALLADLAEHGETGRAAMSALNAVYTGFLKPATAVATAQNDLNAATKALTPTLRGYAKSMEDGKLSGTALASITTTMTQKQQALWGTLTSSYSATQTAAEAYSKLGITALTATGKLRPLSTILGELKTKLKGDSEAAGIATLTAMGFGSSAAKVYETVEGGSSAFDKERAAVLAATAVHSAAVKELGDLHNVFKTVVAAVEDMATKVGQLLMPALTAVVHVLDPAIHGVAKFVTWLSKGSKPALAVAAAIGAVLLPVVGAMGIAFVQQTAKMAAAAVEWVTTQISEAGEFVASVTGMNAAVDVACAGMDAAMQDAAATVAETTDQMQMSFDEIPVAAETAATETDAAMDTMAASTDTAAAATDAAIGSTGIGAILIGVGLAVTLLATHWHAVWDGIKEAAVAVWHGMEAAASALASFFTDVWHGIEDVAKDVWDGIKEYFGIIVPAIATVILGPIGGLVALIATHWETVKSDAVEIWDGIVSFFEGIPGDIEHALESLVSDLETIASDAWHGFLTAAQGAWNLAWDWFVGIPAKVLSIFADAGTWLYDAGKDIVEGLAHGITSAIGDVTHALTSGVGGAVHDVLGFLGIGSPSKLMHDQVGIPIAQGVASGITAGTALIHSAALASVSGLATTMKVHATVAAIASHVAAGGTSVPAAIGGPGLGGASPTTVNFSMGDIHISGVQNPTELAKQLVEPLRAQLLQLRRSMGGTTYQRDGLGLS